jgi:ATP cone domain
MESTPLKDITMRAIDSTNIEDAVMANDKYVVKRDGSHQAMDPVKIRARLENLMEGLAQKHINVDLIINKTVSYAQNGNSKECLNI